MTGSHEIHAAVPGGTQDDGLMTSISAMQISVPPGQQKDIQTPNGAREAPYISVSNSAPSANTAAEQQQEERYFVNEQRQNQRWLKSQARCTEILPSVYEELKAHFGHHKTQERDAAPPLSQQSNALLKRLHRERATQIAREKPSRSHYLAAEDWFVEGQNDQLRDLARLLSNTSFSGKSSSKSGTRRVSKKKSKKASKPKQAAKKGANNENAGLENTQSASPRLTGATAMSIASPVV